MENKELYNEYMDCMPTVDRLVERIKKELLELISSRSIPLGVSIESRIKAWDSINKKIERKSLEIENINHVEDLVGLRIIVLFKRDLAAIIDAISETFTIVDKEDTSARLEEHQFGYQSIHFVVKSPESWLKMPSLKNCGDFCAEIQVRTLAQHIWAASSHQLQYKIESSIPSPVKRSINRVSALLEIVDLEFDRVLQERQSYIESEAVKEPDEPLNVDNLNSILDETLPLQNKIIGESYDELLSELLKFGIKTGSSLRELIDKNLNSALEKDAIIVAESKTDGYMHTSKKRNEKGVFYSFTGLIRTMNEIEFGAN